MIGCVTPPKVYDLTPYGGPKVIKADQRNIQEVCKGAKFNDMGKPRDSSKVKTIGCRRGDELWIWFNRPEVLLHELCHWYTGSSMKARKLCAEGFSW